MKYLQSHTFTHEMKGQMYRLYIVELLHDMQLISFAIQSL